MGSSLHCAASTSKPQHAFAAWRRRFKSLHKLTTDASKFCNRRFRKLTFGWELAFVTGSLSHSYVDYCDPNVFRASLAAVSRETKGVCERTEHPRSGGRGDAIEGACQNISIFLKRSEPLRNDPETRRPQERAQNKTREDSKTSCR